MEKKEFNDNQKNNDEIKANENNNKSHDNIDPSNNNEHSNNYNGNQNDNNRNPNYNNANNIGQHPNNYNGNQNYNNQNPNYNNANNIGQHPNNYNGNQNYNNQNPNYNNVNNIGQYPNNYNGNQNYNNQNPNYNNEQPFLDSILEKDNPQNKLFLKFLFWLSTTVFALTGWITVKAILLYMQILDFQKGLQKGLYDFSSLFGENQIMGAKYIKFTIDAGSLLLDAASIRNILKYIFIVLVILLVLIFLKLRRANNISKFSHINYLSAVIFCIAGIAEIKYTSFLGLANDLVNSEKALETGNLSGLLTTLPDIFMIKVCFIVLLAFSFIATVTNYFLIFRNKKFEMDDVRKEFKVIKGKVIGNGQNNNYQNNNNDFNR